MLVNRGKLAAANFFRLIVENLTFKLSRISVFKSLFRILKIFASGGSKYRCKTSKNHYFGAFLPFVALNDIKNSRLQRVF